MSSFLCFICHSTINSYTSEEVREKYKEVVGMHLCLENQLCYICCYLLKKLCLFKSICLKRSLEYPVLFSEKGTLNLHRTEIETQSICSNEGCNTYQNRITNSKSYHFNNEDSYNIYENNDDNPKVNYEFFENERNDFEEFLNPVLGVNSDIVSKDLESSIGRTDPERSVEINNSLDNDIEDGDVDTKLDSNEVSNNETELEQNDRNIEDVEEYSDHNNDSYADYTEEAADNKNEAVEEQDETDLLYNNTEAKDTINETQENKVLEKTKKKKSKKKDKDFETIELSLEEQKMELDRKRKSKEYLDAQFKCYNCALGFLFKDTYQTHMMRHEESNGEHRCDVCTLRFANPAVLRSHRKSHTFRYRCGACDRQVTSRAHLARCRVTAEASCHLCGRLFQNATGLRQHLKRFHKKNGGRTYSCNVCGKTYNNQGAVRTHMIKHVNRSFPCDECPSTFSSPYTLKQHKKTHSVTETSSHHCAMCDVSFNTRKSLLAHIRNTMSHQQTLFECPICSRVCANHRSVALHMERVHSTNKNYACPSCPATYSNSKSLVRHIGSHKKKVEPKTAVCHLCGNSFKGNTKLNRHLKEVCEKDKLEEELSSYYQNVIDPEPLLN